MKLSIFNSFAGRSRILGYGSLVLTLVALLLATGTAFADCGHQNGARSLTGFKMPFLAQQLDGAKQSHSNPIVGVWHVTYTSGGELFFESLDEWHADGTEIESANVTPTIGNVCMGVWQKVGARSVQLSHIGWNFDSAGNPIGTFTLQETNTVAKGGASYSGTFDYKVYDPDGNLLFEATGTQSATRVTVN